MKLHLLLEGALWIATLLLSALAVLGAGHPRIDTSRREPPTLATEAVAGETAVIETSAHAAIRTITTRNPFSSGSQRAELSAAVPTEFPFPDPDFEISPLAVLVLSGVLGGPPWEALLEGVPGMEGSVLVRIGDMLGDLRIQSIGWDSVVVQGSDTTWTLTIKQVWE